VNAEQPTRLLYTTSVSRWSYFRRMLLALLAAAASFAAVWALLEAANRRLADRLLLDITTLLAIVLGAWFTVRFFFNLIRFISRRSMEIRIYNQGVMWVYGGETHRYKWKQAVRYRQASRGWYLFNRPVVVWGANTLEFQNDDTRERDALKFTAAYGDPRVFGRLVTPYAAYVTSMRMGAALRSEQPVRLHRKLILYPGGVEAGRREIHWSDLDVVLKKRTLIIKERNPRGKLRTVKRYNTHRVDNVGGFLELVSGLIPQYRAAERYHRQSVRPSVSTAMSPPV